MKSGPFQGSQRERQGFVIQSPSRQGKRGTEQLDGNKLSFMNPTFEKWDPSNQVSGVGVTCAAREKAGLGNIMFILLFY